MKQIKLVSNPGDVSMYHGGIKQVSHSQMGVLYADIARRIREQVPEKCQNDVRILVTGSDARYENPIFLRKNSPGELIVTFTQEICNRSSFGDIKVEEIHNAGDTRMFYKGDEKRVFPTRIFDTIVADGVMGENLRISVRERERAIISGIFVLFGENLGSLSR